MHGVCFRGHERSPACSCRRRCRPPLSILVAVSERLELPNGCDTLLVDVAHGMGSQILIDGAEATVPNWRWQRRRAGRGGGGGGFARLTKEGVRGVVYGGDNPSKPTKQEASPPRSSHSARATR